MYHPAAAPGKKKCCRPGPGGVNPPQVKLLADVGYIADRLRQLERCWELAELKDLHKRIVLLLAADECPPVHVVRAIRADQLRPVQADLHARSQLQQEVERAASEARQAGEAKRAQRRLEGGVGCRSGEWTVETSDESSEAKLAQLEDFLVAFYRSYSEVKQASRIRCGKKGVRKTKKVRDRKVFPFLPSSSSSSSSDSSPTHKCHQQQQQQQNKPKLPNVSEQQPFSTSQADRTMNQDREPEDPNVATEQQQQQQAKQQQQASDNPSDAKPEHNSPSATIATTKEEDEDEDVTTNTTTTTTTDQQVTTIATNVVATVAEEKRPSLDAPSSSPLTTSAAAGLPRCPSGDSTEPDEEEDDDDDDDDDDGDAEESVEGERNKLRKRISELANNFASAKQFQQMCDNIDAINDAELRALIRELKRKIEFAERMNWM